MVTTTEIAATITERVSNIPASIASGGNLLNMTNDALIYVQNKLEVIIDAANVPQAYQEVIRNKAICSALLSTHSNVSDYNVTAGDVSVSKADGRSPDINQYDRYAALVVEELKDLKLGMANKGWGQTFYR